MAATYLAWHLLPPALALTLLEARPGRRGMLATTATYLLAAVSQDRVLLLARSCAVVGLAGGLGEPPFPASVVLRQGAGAGQELRFRRAGRRPG